MEKETKREEGPSCACGKANLYEEWLKNENKLKEASEANPSEQTVNSTHSADSKAEEDKMKS